MRIYIASRHCTLASGQDLISGKQYRVDNQQSVFAHALAHLKCATHFAVLTGKSDIKFHKYRIFQQQFLLFIVSVSSMKKHRQAIPKFLPTPTNITVHKGEHAELPCHINNLGPKMVGL